MMMLVHQPRHLVSAVGDDYRNKSISPRLTAFVREYTHCSSELAVVPVEALSEPEEAALLAVPQVAAPVSVAAASVPVISVQVSS